MTEYTQAQLDKAVGKYTKTNDPDQVARWRADGDSTTAENVGKLVRNCDFDQYERVIEYLEEDGLL
jgi:hypothetical protein